MISASSRSMPGGHGPTRPKSSQAQAAPAQDQACLTSSDPLLQKAYESARQRYGAIPGVEIGVCRSPGNSGQPVISLRQAGGKTDGYTVQTHFHGDQAFDAQVDYSRQIAAGVARAWDKSADTVFIMPYAANEDAASRSDWSNLQDLDRLTRDALSSLQLDPDRAGDRCASGHSAGGSALAKALARPAGPGRFDIHNLSRLELYDAAVSSHFNQVSADERARIHSFCRQNPERLVLMPGIIQSSWETYIDKSRWLPRASDHWSPLWDSLGQFRQP